MELCGGAARLGSLHTALRNVTINFSLFDASAAKDLWSARPLLGRPRPGALRLSCGEADCRRIAGAYERSQLHPLLLALRGRRRAGRAPPLRDEVAVLVLADYPNLFHQIGSLVGAYAALLEAGLAHTSASRLRVFLLGDASLSPTAALWSPGLAASPPRFVRASPPPPPLTFAHAVLAPPATEFWWWHVWSAERADRSALFARLRQRILAALRLSPPPPPPRLVLLLQRPHGSDRRLLNEAALAAALGEALAPRGLRVALEDLARKSTREQLRLLQTVGVLLGVHGAGLAWNLFLPERSLVVELLNARCANEYYANQCRWTHRPYVSWQNNRTEREVAATDASGNPLDPFRNHLRADVPAVVQLVERNLPHMSTSRGTSSLVRRR
ncbi:hypothetical protein AB1Y20_008334 [Prymnesium parvum]|uniref:Glycosyltransferase 61 catalytic domain-containing protein n=1 Tax=Prymnesium parvum TaxID=97485 RepID=A0AB34IWS0_PRYPA